MGSLYDVIVERTSCVGHFTIAVFDRRACLDESHAAAVKHTVIAIEKTIGRRKRYLQLTAVMAAKQRANAQAAPRMSAKAPAGRPPSCQANMAENR